VAKTRLSTLCTQAGNLQLSGISGELNFEGSEEINLQTNEYNDLT
jgi:hypothetical protein